MTRRYTGIAIGLHWLVAGFMVINTALALSLDHWPDDWARPVVNTHKSIGITVLGLALLRILWRWSHRPPELPPGYKPWESRLSHLVHLALYALMIGLPLSGWLHDSAWKDAATHPMRWFGLFPWPRIGLVTNVDSALKERLHELFGAVHTNLGYALYVLVALHILGALKHQFIDGESEIQRMWPAPDRAGALLSPKLEEAADRRDH